MSARSLVVALLGILMVAGAAGDPAERLADPQAEARARALFREIRCLVCQNESIDDSEADLAADLRRVIRREVASGVSDSEVRAFLVARYGKFVLLKPPLDLSTLALWVLPFAALGGGAWLAFHRKPSTPPPPPLSPDECERLKGLRVSQGDGANGA